MKKTSTIAVWACCLCLSSSVLYAQGNSGQSGRAKIKPEVAAQAQAATPPAAKAPAPAPIPDRGIPTPSLVEQLMSEQNYTQAAKEFEIFRQKNTKAESCALSYMVIMFYVRLSAADRDPFHQADYQAKIKENMSQMEEKCSQKSDTYLMKAMLYGGKAPDSVVAWATKAIELDPSYGRAYSQRADALWLLIQEDKACADYQKAMSLQDPMAENMYKQRCVGRQSTAPATAPASAPAPAETPKN